MECDYCAYNAYDDEEEEYYCSVNLDEDDMARFMSHKYKKCPYFKNGDEYRIVRHQMQKVIPIDTGSDKTCVCRYFCCLHL